MHSRFRPKIVRSVEADPVNAVGVAEGTDVPIGLFGGV